MAKQAKSRAQLAKKLKHPMIPTDTIDIITNKVIVSEVSHVNPTENVQPVDKKEARRLAKLENKRIKEEAKQLANEQKASKLAEKQLKRKQKQAERLIQESLQYNATSLFNNLPDTLGLNNNNDLEKEEANSPSFSNTFINNEDAQRKRSANIRRIEMVEDNPINNRPKKLVKSDLNTSSGYITPPLTPYHYTDSLTLKGLTTNKHPLPLTIHLPPQDDKIPCSPDTTYLE